MRTPRVVVGGRRVRSSRAPRPGRSGNNDSTIERSYDSLSRLTAETQGPNPLGSSGKTFAFSYSAAGFNTGVTYPDGTVEQRSRDAIGRLSSVAIAGGSSLATYQYAGDRVPLLALPNNEVRTQTYDPLLRKTLVEYRKNTTSQKNFEYVYNLADYRVLEKRHHSGGTGDNYTLDSIYRSVQVKAGVADPVAEYQNPGSQTVASTTGVTYDAAQSRSQVTVAAGGTPTTTNYSTDALNFYTAVGGTTHVRDAGGNLKDDGTNLYDYDSRNQLVRIRRKSDLAVIGTYEYDGTSRRIAKSTSAGTAAFYWIGFELAMEYDASGLFSRRQRGAGFNEVVSAYQRDGADLDQDGSTTDYVPLTPLYDGADDCVGVLDHTGALVESYTHSYDGTVTIHNGSGGTIPTSGVGWQQSYSRMYSDTESGLLYCAYRYYSPAQGRFTSPDPVGAWFDQSNAGNTYGWVANAYRNGNDPLGLKEGCCGKPVIYMFWQMAPFGRGFVDAIKDPFGSRNRWMRDLRAHVTSTLEDKGYRVEARAFEGQHGRDLDDPTNRQRMRNESAHLNSVLNEMQNDPCFDGFVWVGHGGGGGIDIGMDGMNAWDLYNSLPGFGLDCVAILGCQTGMGAWGRSAVAGAPVAASNDDIDIIDGARDLFDNAARSLNGADRANATSGVPAPPRFGS